jgi:hypothetical protein
LLNSTPRAPLPSSPTQVFFHKRSKTLIVTDLVVFIDGSNPAEVVEVPDLLKAALDDPDNARPEDIPPDTPANRRRGWARMALQILFLGPTRFSTFELVKGRLLVSPVIETFVYSKVGCVCACVCRA